MTKNPTMELSGRTSSSCDTRALYTTLSAQMRDFEWRLAHQPCREESSRAETGTEDQAAFDLSLNEFFMRLLAFPCVSAEMLTYKVRAILANREMMKRLIGEEEPVRVLLSSLLCVNRDERRQLPAFHEVTSAVASDLDLRDKVEAVISLLWVMLPDDPADPRIADRHVVVELVSNALLLLMEVRIGLEGLQSAKRRRTPKQPINPEGFADETPTIRRGGRR